MRQKPAACGLFSRIDAGRRTIRTFVYKKSLFDEKSKLAFGLCKGTHLLTSKTKIRMTRHHPLIKACLLAATTAVTLVCSPVRADGIEPLTAILNAPGSAGLGIAARTIASPYLGGGTRYDLVPVNLYEGERLFLHANRAGIKLFNKGGGQDGQRIDLFVEQRLEGFALDRMPTRLTGMAKKDPGIDVGLAYRQRQSWGTMRAELMRDVGGTSRGTEARLGYGYEWRSGPWSLRPDVSVSWRDAKLNDYYYGVRANEASAGRAAYAPGSGIQSELGLYGSYDVSERWRLLAGVSATVLGTSVKNSPIVEKRILPSLYIGAAYDFGSPQRQRREGGKTHRPLMSS